jgi:hypothetical protein
MPMARNNLQNFGVNDHFTFQAEFVELVKWPQRAVETAALWSAELWPIFQQKGDLFLVILSLVVGSWNEKEPKREQQSTNILKTS